MFTAIPNVAGEHAFGRAFDVAGRAASGSAWQALPKTTRRFLLNACPPCLTARLGPRGWCGLVVAGMLLLIIPLLRSDDELMPTFHPSGGRGAVATARAAVSGLVGLRNGAVSPGVPGSATHHAKTEDFDKHPDEHWRMLIPGRSPKEPEAFYASLMEALRARPLGKPCLDYAMDELAPLLDKDSLWLEFGVWMGRSLNQLSKKSIELGRKRKVFGFDSFKGLPETWRSNASGGAVLGDEWAKRWTLRGAFNLGGQPPEYFVDLRGAEFVVGWFNESLPPFLEREVGAVSLVHVDSDLYSSAALSLRLVAPRLRPGTILIFDELINYPGFREGEARALFEWIHSPEFREAGLTGVQVIGYRGPELIDDDVTLRSAIKVQKGEGRKYPQDALFRVW